MLLADDVTAKEAVTAEAAEEWPYLQLFLTFPKSLFHYLERIPNNFRCSLG
jgi:hypothetical protein